ncbi:MAG: hypothetical protein GXN93_05005 [Candidatus Diapherotrites archaeon]|nr:hypothetical protein [Candidatus Diapherotrites archaeon]
MARGIASLIDAVFLMLISATAAAILVYSAAHYGSGLQRQTSRLVMEYYTRQAVRTLAAASVVRPGCDQPDYLLAYMKESLAKNHSLDSATLRDVNSVISKIMAPLTGYYDYAIYLSDDKSIHQIFGICHNCSGKSCSAHFFNSADETNVSSIVNTINSSFYVYSSYAPVRIRYSEGSYGLLVIHFYIWPAGAISGCDKW